MVFRERRSRPLIATDPPSHHPGCTPVGKEAQVDVYTLAILNNVSRRTSRILGTMLSLALPEIVIEGLLLTEFLDNIDASAKSS